MCDEKGICSGTLLVALVAGAAIGTGLALLYAPKSGKDMRKTIVDFSADSVNKIKEYTKEAQDKIKSTIEEGKESILEKKNIVASAIEAGCDVMKKGTEHT
jgi:gas vesicle protein